jgi:hypothetical protein
MSKEQEVEYIQNGRYDVWDKESQSYIEFNPKKPKAKVSEDIAKHLAKQKDRKGNPYFRVKGTKPDFNGSTEPQINEAKK